MRTSLWTSALLAILAVGLIAAFPPRSYDFSSAQDGDWTVGSSWNQAGNPSCSTSDSILVDGDTITANCKIELSGGGAIVIRNEGYLIVEDDLEVTGNSNVDVGSNAGLKVKGDLILDGGSGFTTDGSTEVTGDLDVRSGSATADGSGSLTLGGTGCSDFSGSGSCSQNAPLPVKLVRFEAKTTRKGVRLEWVTATEQQNEAFLIQRSTDGIDYKELGRVEGHGTTNQRHRYDHIDQEELAKDRYYRLVQVDRDGKRTVYGPKVARYDPSKRKVECRMKIVPNPCDGNCKVHFEGTCKKQAEKGELHVQLFDVAGNRINARMERGGGFSSEFLIDTKQRLSPGVYVVRAVDKKGTVASEKMKKR